MNMVKNKTTIKVTIALMALLSTSFVSTAHAAEQSDLASQSPQTITYKINDGYGEYTGTGHTKLEASAQAREACVMGKVEAYEARSGLTPDADTTDLFFDACINK